MKRVKNDGLFPEVQMFELDVYHDERGFFTESFTNTVVDSYEFVQDNHSYSRNHTLRGLHYQLSPGQAKLVRVISGSVLDFVVDVRRDSPTFGKYELFYLTGDVETGPGRSTILIPVGFAHGFFALENTHFVYKVTSHYDPDKERGIRWNDPEIGLASLIQRIDPLVSDKDLKAPLLADAELD